MRKLLLWLACVGGLMASASFFSCGGGGTAGILRQADSLNHQAYRWRYKNLEVSERAATEALMLGKNHSSIKAEALNNLAFCAFIRMDFERADSLLNEVYAETANELECLVADVGMMKICQRTAMNKEFYDYRNSALKRMKRIGEDEVALADKGILRRFNYACSEFSITSSVYYYYLQQEEQSLEAIGEVDVAQELEDDTSQLLYYYYMKGSGGMYEAETPEEIVVGEFDYLMDCLMLSHAEGYVYFEANGAQAMAELLKNKQNYELLLQKRPGMMRVINQKDLPWEELIMRFAENALKLFKEYGDWYQISGTYRTLASCCNELGRHDEALDHLTEAILYVNMHHEKFYHCDDTLDRLRPYDPMAAGSTELKWINAEGIKTVPEWIARFREQLSVTYAALGMKPQSDYNRNIYLDILDYTRQDKELESRYMALEKESDMLNVLLSLVIAGMALFVVLVWVMDKRWKRRYTQRIGKLKQTLEICQRITASVPTNAEEMEDVIQAVTASVKEKMMALVGATDIMIVPCGEQTDGTSGVGYGLTFVLNTSEGQPMAHWHIVGADATNKENKALLEVILPYLSWTLENGLSVISLGDERRDLEKEQYVHEQHLLENKRQNLVKKACLFLVMGITPYIDRVVNEVHKLTSFNYLERKEIKESKYRYIGELITRINEYNDILTLWIKMRKGSLNLNVESFELNPLFEVLQKGHKNFEMKKQRLEVEPTAAVVKADKALTLFMVNTLMENARKYTQQGGEVKVYAREEEDYVEVSVQDNGPGLSEEDVNCILNEKVYDSGKIGIRTAQDAEGLQKSKGSGFGLMNCKGIIEKYRKTNELFRVCCFCIESRMGEGSRFYFRLPKGIRRTLGVWLALFVSVMTGCSAGISTEQAKADASVGEAAAVDSLLLEANRLSERVYNANLEGRYADALFSADSALVCLNEHYMKNAPKMEAVLQLVGEGVPAELKWFAEGFDTDYYILLDVRNEAAVAYLALGELDAYQYNNRAYTSLYKQISVDSSLEEFCVRMQQSTNNKIVAIILCVALLLAWGAGYWLFYMRHRLAYRYGLEQVLEINRHSLVIPASCRKDAMDFVSAWVSDLLGEMKELIPIDVLGIAVYDDGQQGLCHFFSSATEAEEEIKEEMNRCYADKLSVWEQDKRVKCLPLCVEVGEESRCVGVMAMQCVLDNGREDDHLMVQLVANYVAIIVYNVVEVMEQKYRDIEVAQDEARRIIREENQLHVQNMVLDNCLSTIKHETAYYPNRIRQIVEKLLEGMAGEEERRQVETMSEMIGYYKDIFTILSLCAARQLEEVTFRRGAVKAEDLVESVNRYFKRMVKKSGRVLELKVQAEKVNMTGDSVQLKFLLENLVNEAFIHPEDGVLELRICREGAFVRFDFIDRRRCPSQEELNLLFHPHLSRIQYRGEGVLAGTEYLVCKQVIRDHDEFAGRRGCRMNASQMEDGGFKVWFTIPAR